MILVSAAFKAALDNNAMFHKIARVTLEDGTILDLGDDEFTISNANLADAAGSSTFPVGMAICRTIQLELMNDEDQYEVVSFLNASILLSLAVDTDGGRESITLGTFTVTSPETYGTTVILRAQDAMYKADKPFATALTYPTTAGALWAEICASCGIANGMSTIPEADAPISTAPADTLTFRSVLGYIAMLSGGNARVNRDGELEIINYDFTALNAEREAGTAADIHELNKWRQLRTALDDVVITGVQTAKEIHAYAEDVGDGDIKWYNITATADDNGNIVIGSGVTAYDNGYGDITLAEDWNGQSEVIISGDNGYVIVLHNPLWEGREQAAIQTVGTYLIGARFRPFSGDYISYPLAEFGDGCRLTDRRGRLMYSVITDVNFTWTGFTQISNSADDPIRRQATFAETSTTAAQTAVAQEREARQEAIAQLNRVKIGWAEIETAIVNTLEATGVNADWIKAGSIEVIDDNGQVIFSVDKTSKKVIIAGLDMTSYSQSASVQSMRSVKSAPMLKSSDLQLDGAAETEEADEPKAALKAPSLRAAGGVYEFAMNGRSRIVTNLQHVAYETEPSDESIIMTMTELHGSGVLFYAAASGDPYTDPIDPLTGANAIPCGGVYYDSFGGNVTVFADNALYLSGNGFVFNAGLAITDCTWTGTALRFTRANGTTFDVTIGVG